MIAYIRRNLKLYAAKPYWNFIGYFFYYNRKVFFPKQSLIFRRAIQEGIYESININVINKLIKPSTTVFDLGANIGLIAIPILHNNPTIKLISVEASPNTLPFLIKTHKNHSESLRWKIIDKAISNKSEKVDFQLANLADGAYESLKDTKRTSFKNTIKVDCTTIDTIWDGIGQPAVSFIKSDIEGADLLALHGGINCIKSCSPSILMEWNQTNVAPFELSNSDLLRFSEEIKYSIYCLPYFNKISTIEELNLFGKFYENFLLIPNKD